MNNKPLALSQGCSTKNWAKRGITQIVDLFDQDKLLPWDDLKVIFNIPNSHKKTYNMIVQASKDLPSLC